MKMKKMFAVIAFGATLIIPLSVSAMSPLTDRELSAVTGTGQAGTSMDLSSDGIGTNAALLKNWVNPNQINGERQTATTVDNTTHRGGVSINVDVSMDLYCDVIAWGDKDGLGTAGASGGGWVGLSQLNITGLRIGPRR